MSEAERILLMAELAAVRAKERVISDALGGAVIAPVPSIHDRRRRKPSPKPPLPPSADELAGVTDIDRARMEQAARRKGVVL